MPVPFHKYTVDEIYHAPRPICIKLVRWDGSQDQANTDKGQQWLPMQPGIYTIRRWGFFHKQVIVWGDANNRLMACIIPWVRSIATRTPIDLGTTRGGYLGKPEALVQLPAEANWRWVRDLLPADLLPGLYGPTVEAFVARDVAPKPNDIRPDPA